MLLEALSFRRFRERPFRVLVVDDNRDAADSLGALLALDGFDTRVCYDGLFALPLAKDFCPDVCILDLYMPYLNGWAVARQLREWAGGRQLFIVAISGQTLEEQKSKTTDQDFDCHYEKPYDHERIGGDIAAFFDRSAVNSSSL